MRDDKQPGTGVPPRASKTYSYSRYEKKSIRNKNGRNRPEKFTPCRRVDRADVRRKVVLEVVYGQAVDQRSNRLAV
jgi:hypothetical protein